MNKHTAAITFDKEVVRHHATPQIAKLPENRLSKLAIILLSLLSLLFTGCMLWGDLDAIRDGMMEDARAKQKITLILNTSHLANSGDTALFSNGANEITAQRNSTVSIAYTLDSEDDNNWFGLYINGNRKYQTTVPGTRTFNYTVNPADANNNVIIIYAHSMHSNLILLDPPSSVALNKSGAITFTAGANNAATGATHSFTLYRDNTQVPRFIDQTITNGETPEDIVTAMLTAPGDYQVKVRAQTSNPDYLSPDNSVESNTVHVYEVSATINSAQGNGTTNGNTRTINITANTNVTAAFADFPLAHIAAFLASHGD